MGESWRRSAASHYNLFYLIFNTMYYYSGINEKYIRKSIISQNHVSHRQTPVCKLTGTIC